MPIYVEDRAVAWTLGQARHLYPRGTGGWNGLGVPHGLLLGL